MGDERTIGVFDSGMGGITVLQAIRAHAPGERCIYLADSQQAPYGTKTPREIERRCDEIVEYLLGMDAKAIVVACNTASVVALGHLRQRFDVPFIGLDPGVKPAAEQTRTATIGVLATPTTAVSRRLARLIQEFAVGTRVVTQMCPDLVPLIEQGVVGGEEMERLLAGYLTEILAAGADVVVLGCTHYAFVRPIIERLCGPSVMVLDPVGAVARQVARVLRLEGIAANGQVGSTSYFTTGDPATFARVFTSLTGREPGPVRHVAIGAAVG
ncbi:MAG TPA: glutamate racemase [Chloroflexota bacterium]|nr:glutamate racemase [Chloroflexota bacterium]